MRHFPLVAALISGCASSYTSLAVDVSRASRGAVAPMMTGADQRTGRAAIGFGTSAAAMEVVLHGHDLATSDDAWLAGSAGLELALRLAQLGPVRAFAHGGPMRGVLFDASTASVTWGVGLAGGVGLSIGTGIVHVVVDARNEEQWFAGTATEQTLGNCSLRSVAVGLRLGR